MAREAADPAARAFSAETVATEPVVVIRVSGDVDAATAGALGDTLDVAIREHGRHVVVDAVDVGFIDSTGISVLVDARRRLNRARRRIAVAAGPGALRRCLEVTGLINAFDVHATASEAVGALGDAPLLGR